MNEKTVYFRDNFFSAGRTEIFNEAERTIGILDLKSAFSAGVEIMDAQGQLLASGKLPFLGGSWIVMNESGQEIGKLKAKFSLFSKKFEYEAYNRGVYTVEAAAFSKEYSVISAGAQFVAKFERVSGIFSAPAFQLTSHSESLSIEELIAVVMGVNAIQKRRQNAANSAT